MVEARVVALKVAHAEVVDDWGRKETEKEARIVSRLDHPNIAAVRNADWIEGRFVIASDLAVANLSKYPRARRFGPVALRIVRDVAAGLAYAHERRLMHRDVKPENILIYADGRAAITDFGASRFAKGLTRAYNTETGTLGYMAPEQAYGRVRFASDVFSLGLIAYEVLTGILPMWPFEWPPERFDVFEAKVPQPLHAVLRKAARFDPKLRYKDAVEFHTALEAAFARIEKAPKRKRAPGAATRTIPLRRLRTSRWCARTANAVCGRSGRRARGAIPGVWRATAERRPTTRTRNGAARRAVVRGNCVHSCATARSARPSRAVSGSTSTCPTAARAVAGRPRIPFCVSARGAAAASRARARSKAHAAEAPAARHHCAGLCWPNAGRPNRSSVRSVGRVARLFAVRPRGYAGALR